MPIITEWGDPEKTILVHHYVGRWDMTDVHLMLDATQKLRREVTHRVDSIVDMTESLSNPSSLMSAANRVERSNELHEGLSVVIKPSRYIRTMGNIIGRIFPNLLADTRFVDTLDEAYAVIAAERAKDASAR